MGQPPSLLDSPTSLNFWNSSKFWLVCQGTLLWQTLFHFFDRVHFLIELKENYSPEMMQIALPTLNFFNISAKKIIFLMTFFWYFQYISDHLETPANGQAAVFLTGWLEAFISEISFWQQYGTTLSVISDLFSYTGKKCNLLAVFPFYRK